MKLVSWNVNGLRACIQKGFLDQFNTFDADFYCLQETKLSEGQLQLDLPGYEQYWCYAEKKGYSGTAIFTKHTPLSVHYGLDVPELDNEGRLITLEYPEFYLLTCYTPNAQRGLARIDHRMKWDEALRAYLQKLDALKPVILCGDLNVAHQEIDLKNPKSNRGNAGFSDEERESFQKTLNLGFTDTFRHMHPDAAGCYSWWSYMFKARENNAGWRIDYFLVSDRVKADVYRADIHSDILGSDHCPVSIGIDLTCNGGIWSPTSLGAAKLHGAREKTDNEPKASAVNAKALAPLAVLCALLICCVLLWPYASDLFDAAPGPTDPPSFYEYTILESRPKINHYESTGSEFILLHALLNGTDTHYLAEPIPFDSYLDTNTWLRVDLTEAGLQTVDDSWQMNVYNLDSILSGFSPTPTPVSYYICPYYLEDEHTQLRGWYVFMTLESPTTYTLSLGNDDENITETIKLIPDIDLSELEVHMTALPLESAPIEVNDDPMTGFPEQWDDRVSLAIDGYTYYAEAVEPVSTVVTGRYWIYVEPSFTLLEYVPIEAMTLSVRAIYLGLIPYGSATVSSGTTYQLVRPVYRNNDLTEQTGWLVYGTDLSASHLWLELICTFHGKDFSFDLTVDHHPSSDDAKTFEDMTTSELVDYVMTNEAISQLFNDVLSSPTLPNVPALEELATRDDAVSALMNCTPPKDSYYWDAPYFLLQLETFRAKMTPKEEADFLTGNYSTNYVDMDSIYGMDDPGDLPTSDTASIVTALLQNTENHAVLMARCTRDETRQYVYLYLRELVPQLLELEQRVDALRAIVSWAADPNYGISILPYLVDLWPFIESIQPENMTTDQLVEYIMANDELCQLIVNLPSISYYPYYPEEPYLEELAAREDAVSALMNCIPPDSEDYRTVPETLLLMPPFYAAMTPSEEASYLTGDYRSSPSGITYSVGPDLSLLDAYSTPMLLDEIRFDSELEEYLLFCSSYDVREQVYLILRQHNTFLQALETRDDALSTMEQMQQDPAQSSGTLPFLIELWPFIESIQPENMTTDELVASIFANDALVSDLSYMPPGADYPQYYTDLLNNDPLLRELTAREDAIAALMNCQPPPYINHMQIPLVLMVLDQFSQKMTAEEEARFLTGDYPSHMNGITYGRGLDLEILESYPTTMLLDSILYDSELEQYLLDCSGYETREQIYLILRQHNTFLQALETRDDALSTMEQLQQDPAQSSGTLPFLIELWPFIQSLYDEAA